MTGPILVAGGAISYTNIYGDAGEANVYLVDGLDGWTGGRQKNPVGFANNGSSVWITIDGDVSEMPDGSIVVVQANTPFTISTSEPVDLATPPE